jgi:hypothetical protein
MDVEGDGREKVKIKNNVDEDSKNLEEICYILSSDRMTEDGVRIGNWIY